ncbi:MAG: YncE family protein [Candidatus Competibacteraceae bacterium]
MSESINSASSVTPQLNFRLGNPNAPGTIYVSKNPADNQLQLVMSSTVEVKFTAGELAPPGSAGKGTGSLLYLELTPLGLSQAEFDALELVAEGWTSQQYSDQHRQYLGFTPTAEVSLLPESSITLTLKGFTIEKQPGLAADLEVLAYRVTGVTSSRHFSSQSNISVLFAPPDNETGKLTDAVAVKLTPDEVVTSVKEKYLVKNRLTLSLQHQPNAPEVRAKKGAVFTLTFVYANPDSNGYGALLTVEDGKKVTVTTTDSTTGWKITSHDADPPCWTLEPPADKLEPPADKSIFGSGGRALAFEIDSLTTRFRPGATVALLGYSKLQGYKSGSFAITILKRPHVDISSFTVTPTSSVLDQDTGQAKVTLNWSTTDAQCLTLHPGSTDVTGVVSYDTAIATTTEFTLVAEGRRPGNVNNVATSSILAQVLPVINSFIAAPSAVAATDFPAEVWFSWNVNTKQNVTLTSSTAGPDSNLYTSTGSLGKQLKGPQMLTLSPQGGAAAGISRSIIVNAFQPQASFPQLAGGGSSTAASPTASFIAVSLPSQKKIEIVSTATYQSLATVQLKGTPDRLAFSPDGATLFVACADPHAVIPVTVTPATADEPYSFSVGEAIAMPDKGKPQDLAVGSDGRVWVTVDMGDGNDGQVVAFRVCDPTQRATASVGPAPRRIALSPNGSTAYVVHQGGNSVSVICTGANGLVAGQPAPNISDPVDLAVSPDGSHLLIATRSKNLLVLKTNLLYDSTRQSYPMPGTPTSVAVFPGGSYAAVACKDKNVVVLVNYSKEPKLAHVVASVDLDAAPAGVTVTPDNGLLFVGMPKVSNLGVIGLSNYIQSGTPVIALGGMVTDLAPTPDGKTLFVWYDATLSVQVSGKQPALGLFAIDVQTRSRQTWQEKLKVTAAVVSPAANDNRIYVATRQTNSVAVYEITTGKRLFIIRIDAKDGATSRQPINLAITADGRRLFVMTADRNRKYSVVAFDCNTYKEMSNQTVFTASTTPLKVLMAAASDGSAVYAVDTTASTFYALKPSDKGYVPTGEPLALAAGIPSAIAILPDNSRAYVAIANASNSTNAMSIIDLANWTVKTIYLPDSIYALQIKSLAVLPDGNKLLATDGLFAGIRLFDAASLRIVQTLSWSDVQSPCGIAIAPDGSWIATANLSSGNVAVATQVQPSQSTR